jgi:effector-binding domain-containing protein
MSLAVNPELVTRPAQWSVVIPVEASLSEWNKTIDVIPQILGWIEANEVEPASPLFYRYRRIGDLEKPFSVEIGFAVNEQVAPSGNVVLSEMEGGTYLTYLHQGHPDQLFETGREIEMWAETNEITFDVRRSGDTEVWKGRYEFFLTNPDDEPDPNNWEIKIAWLTRNSPDGDDNG